MNNSLMGIWVIYAETTWANITSGTTVKGNFEVSTISYGRLNIVKWNQMVFTDILQVRFEHNDGDRGGVRGCQYCDPHV